MSKEGEGYVYDNNTCPLCGGDLYCTMVGIVWHVKCVAQGCEFLHRRNNLRHKAVPIPFPDRRRNNNDR